MFAQLGYPNDAATIERRLISRGSDSCVLLAQRGERITGFIALQILESLLSGEMAEIAALVVDETQRGHGTGVALLRAAEAWAHQRGFRHIRVRSNVIRTDAHRFYQREGYAPVKDQRVFEKRDT
ncbi:MAG TPA: GNAT family N-acetyltransferase [Candidatus Acidoferrum sp.]|nr:GNAT family N-acetyltransferase [Candidatus Acidoferrum sp.]